MDNASSFISKYFSWLCLFRGGHEWKNGAQGFEVCEFCGKVRKHRGTE